MKNNFSRGLKSDEYNDSSVIKQQLEDSLKNDEGYLIIAHDGNKYTGWGMAYNKDKSRRSKGFQCYVVPRQRRKGIGTRLLEKACSLLGRVEVYDHATSHKFFKANGLTNAEAITGKKLKKI
jgi:GNAT superfamily N-acetyltransferase